MITAIINTDLLIHKMNQLEAALLGSGKDGVELVKGEVRQLSRTIVNFVPPIGANAKEIGEHAVEVGISAVISEATPVLIDEVGSKYGLKDISTAYVTETTGEKLNLEWENIDPIGERIEQYHEQYRNQAGRTPRAFPQSSDKWQARAVVPVGTKQPYAEKKKKMVGLWKASWAYAGAMAGFKFVSWISRHFGTLGNLGIYEPYFDDPKKPFAIIGSRFAGNSRIIASIQKAVQVRARASEKRLGLLMNNYKQQWENGTTIRPGINQTPEVANG